jgi:hypothetical protein
MKLRECCVVWEKKKAMGAQAQKGFEGEPRGRFASEYMRELFLPGDDSDPIRTWRGLLLAVLLATPFWVALYFLLRWWIS